MLRGGQAPFRIDQGSQIFKAISRNQPRCSKFPQSVFDLAGQLARVFHDVGEKRRAPPVQRFKHLRRR
jgi:hypothetical protein